MGFAALDGQPGVVSVEKGWHNFREINRVVYDPKTITIDQMKQKLEKAGTYISTLKK